MSPSPIVADTRRTRAHRAPPRPRRRAAILGHAWHRRRRRGDCAAARRVRRPHHRQPRRGRPFSPRLDAGGRDRPQGARRQSQRPRGHGRDAARGAPQPRHARGFAARGFRRAHRRLRLARGETGARSSAATSPDCPGRSSSTSPLLAPPPAPDPDAGRPGHEFYVTGYVGAAAAGLASSSAASTATGSTAHGASPPASRDTNGLTPACAAASRWREVAACARAIDLSDGLADAARQLASASGTGVVIEAGASRSIQARAPGQQEGGDPMALALSRRRGLRAVVRGFPAAAARVPRRRAPWTGLAVTRIGALDAASRDWLVRGGRREPLDAGFVHF